MSSTTARTSPPTITLAARAWSHLMPLARGTVSPDRFALRVDLRGTTPHPLDEAPTTVAEASFSGYVRRIAAGDDRFVGLPVFLMRAFRHRCFLVPKHSELLRLEDLRGRTIGVTGWPDSGNTWTRSLLRRAGVGLDEATWVLAPLLGGTLEASRVGSLPDNVMSGAPGRSLLEALAAGDVDAVMAPFVPDQVHADASPVRHLLPDYRAAEAAYHADVGFVPGIHVMTVHRDLVEQHPWLPAALVATLQRSKDTWATERWQYADTTPWMLDDLQRTDATTGRDWTPYGVAANAAMVTHFCAELAEQSLLPAPIDPAAVFADYLALTETERT